MNADTLMYINVEIERAREISEPLREKMEDDELLEDQENIDLNYYEGYADAMRAVKNYFNSKA